MWNYAAIVRQEEREDTLLEFINNGIQNHLTKEEIKIAAYIFLKLSKEEVEKYFQMIETNKES